MDPMITISSSVGIGGNKEDEAILEKKPSRNQPTMPQRNCNLSQEKELKSGRTITLPIEESTYEEMLSDSRIFRTEVDHYAEQWPELFPAEIRSGYHLHGKRGSKKLDGFEMQRIKLIEPDEAGKSIVLSIKPSAVMPYMTGYTDEVEKAHYLRQYGVPYSGLTYVFGRSDSYWYRQTTHLGRYSLVQTTIQQPENLPEDLLADEKHSRLLGQKCYIATTVGNDCVLGASVATAADEVALTEAYQTFKEEALHFCPEYQPKTVNTDGWTATQNSWRALFPMIVLIECILHAFISIRSRCKKKFSQAWPELQKKFWDVYDSPTKALFLSSLTDFQTWANTSLSGIALEAVNKLSNKSAVFAKWYQHPTARRTSNMVDRHMEPMDRHLNSTKYFHGHLISAEKSIRAWALLHNFSPYCQRSYTSKQWQSPAHKLNGAVYHDNWLHNLLVSTSNSPVIILSHQFRQN